ncbi:Aminopeptidase N [Daphnia magna]|uniref:Aminopeptidase n=1 Tax=Daphnia magna TaxID=35525 RepID=A0A0P6A6Q7_9CRUS|nr:Aminopeptidase N [Daphnia magna]
MTLSPYLLFIVAVVTVSTTAATSATKRVGRSGEDLRLPRDILPRSYEVTLLPILIEGNFTTEGYVSISVDCIQSTNNITLHIADIIFNPVDIELTDLATGQLISISSVVEDKVRQFLILTPNAQLLAGRQYRLSMAFTSILNNELRGFYRSSYNENATTKYMAVSQMQPTDARRAFPCFDEPNMKANFTMKLGRLTTQLSTSNMPVKETTPIADRPGYVWDLFETSLPVSTYLVGMMVSEFTFIDSPAGLSTTPFRIWTRPEAVSQAEYASRIGPQVLSFYEDYFQIAFPLPKQDMVALKDLSFGGMENWGMITYRETALLFDPVKSSESDKQRVVTVVAHELAHQWFGDLVTMDWWSELWLNEGFASYMEYLGANYVEPEFGLIEQIVINDIQDVFGVDALESSHPISVEVNDPNEINELFDDISYAKGASIIRMLNKFLGEQSFRAGLTNYLNGRKYSNAVADDLWSALTAQAIADNVNLPVDVRTIMNTWTLKMGYPIVTVTRDYATSAATVSQERFLLRSNPDSTDETVYRWWIPLTYTSDFSQPQKSSWLAFEQPAIQISNVGASNRWVIFNVDQVGYYRVNYDDANWNMIIAQLLLDYQQISLINRAQLLDDSLNIARVNALPYAFPLELTQYLTKEQDYIPWTSALNGLSYLDLMYIRTTGYGEFKGYLTKLVTPLYDYVKFNDTVGDSHLLIYTRVTAVTWACKLDIGDCVSNSVNFYQAWMNDPTNPTIVPVNQKATITCTAIANGGDPEWDFAFQRYLDSNVAAESSKLLFGLSCSTDPLTLQKLLEWSLDPTSGIRRNDASSVFINVGSNPIGRDLTFDFIQNRWSDMVAYFPSLYDLARIVDSVSEGFNTPAEVEELKQLQADHADELGTAARAIDQSIERSESNVEWMSLHYQEVLDWIQQNP